MPTSFSPISSSFSVDCNASAENVISIQTKHVQIGSLKLETKQLEVLLCTLLTLHSEVLV